MIRAFRSDPLGDKLVASHPATDKFGPKAHSGPWIQIPLDLSTQNFFLFCHLQDHVNVREKDQQS